jgi:Family of unknown function (DUF6496)
MPDQETIKRAQEDLREGKSPSTAAGEFVKQEMDHIREGKHGARNAKQAIAIGLSEARRAGIPLGKPNPKTTSAATQKKAARDSERGQTDPVTGEGGQTKRGRASEKALEREPKAAASHLALSRHAKSASKKRTAADRSASAKKAARTREAEGRIGPPFVAR